MEKRTKTTLRVGIVLILFYVALQHLDVLIACVEYVWSIFYPVIIGLCFAFVLNVIMNIFEDVAFARWKKTKRAWSRALVRPVSMILTYLSLLGLIVLVVGVVVPTLTDTISMLLDNSDISIENLIRWLTETAQQLHIPEEYITELQNDISDWGTQIIEFLRGEASEVASFALDVTASLVDLSATMILAICLSAYVLASKERITGFLNRMLEAYLRAPVFRAMRQISHLSFDAFTRFIRGQFVEAIILGVLCFLGMLVFRFPFAAVTSLLIGVSALIPIAGAWIGGIVGALLILMVDPSKVLWFVVFLVSLQQIEGNLIYPRVVGTSIGLPGIIVLSAIIVGGNVNGIFGMLVSVPISSILFELCKRSIELIEHKKRSEPLPADAPPESEPQPPIVPAPNIKPAPGVKSATTKPDEARQSTPRRKR